MDYKQTHLESEHKHNSPLFSCRFSPDGKQVAFGAEDYKVWIWNQEGELKPELDTDAWARALAYTPDGKTLITGGYDGRLLWWPVNEGKPQPSKVVDAHKGWIRAIDISKDGTMIASVGNDLVIRIWNVSDGALRHTLQGELKVEVKVEEKIEEKVIAHDTHIYNVAFHPDGKFLVTGDLMGQLIVWDLETEKPIRTWTAESLSKYDKGFRAQIGGFRGLRFNADGSKLYASGITAVTNAFAGVGNPSVVEFDWAEGKQTIEYLSNPKKQGVAWRAVPHSEGPIIGVHGGSGGTLLFWEPGTADTSHQVNTKQNGRDLDMNHNRVCVACSDGMLRIYLMDAKPA